MTKDIKVLQGEYVTGTLADEDVALYLSLLEADYGAEFREDRMSSLKSRLRGIERRSLAEERREAEIDALIKSGIKFREITQYWEMQGAVRASVADGYADAWTYEGREIYRMYGALSGLGKHIDEVLADVQRIDVEFQELLRKGANT